MQAQPGLEENVFAAAEAKFRFLIAYASTHALTHDHAQIEQCLWEEGFEFLRLLYQAHLEVRAQAEGRREVVGADAVPRPNARSTTRFLETVFGTVTVRRLSYSASGVESLRPADADLNLPERLYSDGVCRRVAASAAKEAFGEVVESVATSSAAHIAKRQAEVVTVEAAQDFEAFYEHKRALSGREAARTGSTLVITADGKGVVMRPEDLRPATKRAAKKRSRKRQTRLSVGEKRGSKRMATVASVYTLDRFERSPEQIVPTLAPVREGESAPPRPEHKRVWASLEREPDQVLRDAFQEATRRDPHGRKEWVALVDGNPTQLKILKALSGEYEAGLVIILDFIHVLGYLWRAVSAFCEPQSKEAEAWVGHRAIEILRGHASQVAGGMRRSATRRGLTAEQRASVDKCADYLLKNGPYLRYDQYLACGYPIASGVIEGACRHLVKDRMDISGARWRLAGAEAVLKLRSLRSSGDFDEYWDFHRQRDLERTHRSRYHEGQIPPLPASHNQAAPRSPLRLVAH